MTYSHNSRRVLFGILPRRPTKSLQIPIYAVVLSYVLLGLAAISAIVPFFYVLSTSLKETRSLFSYPPQWLPWPLFYGNYQLLFTEHPMAHWLFNSILVAVAVTGLKLVIDALAAYALVTMEFHGKQVLMVVLLLAVAIPTASLLIPLFILVRGMGLLDHSLALILPPLANPLGVFMLRASMSSLPHEIFHAARLEGASEGKIFTRLVLPLIKPGLVVHAIYIFMTQYTSLLWPLVAIRRSENQVITAGIASLKGNFVVDWGLISAASLLAAIPITVIFILLQRYFMAESLAGALKE
ncbi:MAG: carbohydrate ABC transporter permease [Candidatus Symbiobacter sp.]|nr:carbohydrate ABC transporter permease [Candidatus Symbiobacter sp.]